jgi:hypothetical protein
VDPTRAVTGNEGSTVHTAPTFQPRKRPRRRNLGSLSQAADLCGCSTYFIRRQIALGNISGYRMGTKAIRVDLDEAVEKLLRPIPATVKPGRRQPGSHTAS